MITKSCWVSTGDALMRLHPCMQQATVAMSMSWSSLLRLEEICDSMTSIIGLWQSGPTSTMMRKSRKRWHSFWRKLSRWLFPRQTEEACLERKASQPRKIMIDFHSESFVGLFVMYMQSLIKQQQKSKKRKGEKNRKKTTRKLFRKWKTW